MRTEGGDVMVYMCDVYSEGGDVMVCVMCAQRVEM